MFFSRRPWRGLAHLHYINTASRVHAQGQPIPRRPQRRTGVVEGALVGRATVTSRCWEEDPPRAVHRLDRNRCTTSTQRMRLQPRPQDVLDGLRSLRIFGQRQQGFEGTKRDAQVTTCAGRIGDAHHGLSHGWRSASDLLSPAHAPILAEGLKGLRRSEASWWRRRRPWSGWNV